jgi:thiol-disulfide isomerase/thioredoxin
MIKIVNTVLFVFLLSACSSQESHENNTSNQTTVNKTTQKTTTATPVATQTSTILTNKEENNSKTITEKNTVEKTATSTEKPSKNSLFSLTTLEGKTITIQETSGGLIFEEFKNKAVILLFFGYKCPPCLGEIPVLKALENKGHKDLEIVALEVQGLTHEQLELFKDKKGINYNLVSGEGNYNFISYIGEKANWQGAIPFLIGFDKMGAVKIVHVGGIGASQFDNIYDSLVK